MAVTARDVARAAGVSPATVSLVFRNKRGVGDATRRRVHEVARELGFVYRGSDAPARTSTLHLVIYEKHGRVVGETAFFKELTQGITDETYAQGFHRLALSYFFAAQSPSKQLRSMRSTKCAGIILLCTEMDPAALRHFRDLDVPIVLLDSWYPGVMIDSVVIDNQCATWMAMRQLTKAGHSEIGHLRCKVPIRNFRERNDGYQVAMTQLKGSTFDPATYTVVLGPSVDEARADMAAWLAAGNRPHTAYFADNDLLAAGALQALQEAGYRVPEDVSIIGFDDTPLCTLVQPHLSTMCVSKERMGALAVRRLVDLIRHGHREHIRLTVMPEVVLRDSIAAPRERGA